MDMTEMGAGRRPRGARALAGIGLTAVAVGGGVLAARAWPGAGGGRASVSFVTDVADPRRLVGVVDNVFVGRVDDVQGVHTPSGMPETRYGVTVIENIKGHLDGGVTVNQQGGIAPGASAPVLVEGDAMLVVGAEYLFATRVGGGGAWHTLVPRYGDVPIADDAERERLVAALRAAATEAIPYEP